MGRGDAGRGKGGRGRPGQRQASHRARRTAGRTGSARPGAPGAPRGARPPARTDGALGRPDRPGVAGRETGSRRRSPEAGRGEAGRSRRTAADARASYGRARRRGGGAGSGESGAGTGEMHADRSGPPAGRPGAGLRPDGRPDFGRAAVEPPGGAATGRPRRSARAVRPGAGRRPGRRRGPSRRGNEGHRGRGRDVVALRRGGPPDRAGGARRRGRFGPRPDGTWRRSPGGARSGRRVPAAEAEICDLRGKPEDALEKYQQAVRLGERRPAVVRRLVDLLYERQRYVDADQVLREVQEGASLPAGLDQRGMEIALRNQNPERALALARQAAADRPADYRSHVWLGLSLWAVGRRDEAEASLRQSRAARRRFPGAPRDPGSVPGVGRPAGRRRGRRPGGGNAPGPFRGGAGAGPVLRGDRPIGPGRGLLPGGAGGPPGRRPRPAGGGGFLPAYGAVREGRAASLRVNPRFEWCGGRRGVGAPQPGGGMGDAGRLPEGPTGIDSARPEPPAQWRGEPPTTGTRGPSSWRRGPAAKPRRSSCWSRWGGVSS